MTSPKPPPVLAGAGTTVKHLVDAGENVRLRCNVTGSPRPEVTWRKTVRGYEEPGNFVVTHEVIGDVTVSTLAITSVTVDDDADYTCRIG